MNFLHEEIISEFRWHCPERSSLIEKLELEGSFVALNAVEAMFLSLGLIFDTLFWEEHDNFHIRYFRALVSALHEHNNFFERISIKKCC